MSDQITAMTSNLVTLGAARIGPRSGDPAYLRAIQDKAAAPAANQIRDVADAKVYLDLGTHPGPSIITSYAGESAIDIDNGKRAHNGRARQLRALFLLYVVAKSYGLAGDGAPGAYKMIGHCFDALENVDLLDGGEQGQAITIWGGATLYDEKPQRIIYQVKLFADFVRLRPAG